MMAFLPEPHNPTDLRREESRVVRCGEWHEHHAIRESAPQQVRHPNSQARLSDAANPGERQESDAASHEQARDFRHLWVSTD
jgi:hypothetical protein